MTRKTAPETAAPEPAEAEAEAETVVPSEPGPAKAKRGKSRKVLTGRAARVAAETRDALDRELAYYIAAGKTERADEVRASIAAL